MDIGGRYKKASIITAANLKTVARSARLRDLSSLALPEVDAVAELVAQMVPAGNLPGMILNGMARLAGRQAPLRTVRRDVNLLFKGVEQTLDRVLYTAVFAGPAAVIWGYQHLLRLAGKDPEDSFPEGTWQFYADYALREDTARHTNETQGFDTILNEHGLQVGQADRMTAWVIIKGREILSNVGAVVPSSTVTRFSTAKDDNEKKTLAWGIVTDAEGVMCISLRDFRPHVAMLLACGQRATAEWMARDYLLSYARGLNAFVRDLHQITRASRETHGAG